MASALLTCLAALALMLSSCATLGVAHEGAGYFAGKKEKTLVRYFMSLGYEGDVLAEDGDGFDRMVYFSTRYIAAYMEWSSTTRTKSRRYSDINDFEYLQMSDGCYVARGNSHYEYRYDPGTVSVGTPGTGYQSGTPARTYQIHCNDNGTVSSWINQFNSNVRSCGAVSSENDSSRFNAGNVGDRYYIYSIASGSATLGGEYATIYRRRLRQVDIYMDVQTKSDTQAAYYYDISKDMYYAADRRTVISKDEALANVSSYQSQGYTLRKETKGLSLVAVIKDGVVIDVMQADSPSDLELDLNKALVIAVMGNSFAWVNELLLCGADPNIQDEDGYTALMYAVLQKNAEIVKTLLEGGANPNTQDEDGLTVLMGAVMDENAEIVRLLLDAGANPNIQEYEYGNTALDMAEWKGNAEIIRMLSQ